MSARCLIDFSRDRLPRLQGRFENPREVLVARQLDEIIPLLRAAEAHAQNGRWAAGMVAYEAAAAFDPALQTHEPLPHLPLAAFAIYDKAAPLAAPPAAPFTCQPWNNDTTRDVFDAAIKRIRGEIANGDYYQTNFTTRLTAGFDGDAEAFFHALTEAQPGGYSLFMDFGAWQIASASPELFFSWNPETRALTTRPMKGTSAPGKIENLKNSTKDRAENLMIVDLLRNDLSRVATDVRVPELFVVQTLPTALQMTSTVTGTTRPGIGLADIFAALFPCGSITGAPKIAAMQAIKELETSPRGAYCGALGIVQPGGETLFSVGIRGVTIENGKAVCGIGSGITWDSKDSEEYAENQVKQRFLWRASAEFDLVETLRLENEHFPLLERHLARLGKSATHFGFHEPEKARGALQDLASMHPQGLHRVRLLADRKGNVKTEIYPLEETHRPVRVVLASHAIDSDSDFIRHKTTNRAIYDAFKPASEIFDTLLYNEHGEITEFTRGNVAVELNGALITPPLSCGLLPGTLRAEMLAKGKLAECVITRDDLYSTTKIYFLNGLRGMIEAKLNP